MKMTREELQAMFKLLDITKPAEMDCGEFLSRVGGYVEQLSATEGNLPPGYEDLLHHLRACPECLEEFRVLCEALKTDP
ncbi:MAG: hypothetical protein AAF581_09100 [Planctomycetota bacterium]